MTASEAGITGATSATNGRKRLCRDSPDSIGQRFPGRFDRMSLYSAYQSCRQAVYGSGVRDLPPTVPASTPAYPKKQSLSAQVHRRSDGRRHSPPGPGSAPKNCPPDPLNQQNPECHHPGVPAYRLPVPLSPHFYPDTPGSHECTCPADHT